MGTIIASKILVSDIHLVFEEALTRKKKKVRKVLISHGISS